MSNLIDLIFFALIIDVAIPISLYLLGSGTYFEIFEKYNAWKSKKRNNNEMKNGH